MPTNLENSAVATGLKNVSFHSHCKGKHCKQCSKYSTIALISQAKKVMLKILQARFLLKEYVYQYLYVLKNWGSHPGEG